MKTKNIFLIIHHNITLDYCILDYIYQLPPPTSTCQLLAIVTLPHCPPCLTPCLSYQHLCLCFLDFLQTFPACPRAFYPCYFLPSQSLYQEYSLYPIPTSTLINLLFLNVQFKVIPSLKNPLIPSGRGNHSLFMTLWQHLCHHVCGLLKVTYGLGLIRVSITHTKA